MGYGLWAVGCVIRSVAGILYFGDFCEGAVCLAELGR